MSERKPLVHEWTYSSCKYGVDEDGRVFCMNGASPLLVDTRLGTGRVIADLAMAIESLQREIRIMHE